jgi:zinc-ribbon domain
MCGIMGDPELRSDESVLLRTQGIFVKSIPFEGILTNKRIILIDRATNLLPQKEIPLVTLKDFQAGENAIRDQIITLYVLAKTGETRQMILTFSRQTGGTRIKERDDWMRVLKENTSSSFEQVIRKVIPGVGRSPKKTTRTAPPRIEIVSSPVSHKEPAAEKTAMKKEGEDIAPVKKIIKTSTASSLPSSAANESDASPQGYGTYCSRCGNRVPDVSKFCNRCGSQIVVPGTLTESKTPQSIVSQLPVAEYAVLSLASVPSNTSGAAPQRPATSEEQLSLVTPPESISSLSDSDLHGMDDKSEAAQPVIIDSTSKPMAPSGKPSVPKKPWHGLSFKPGKKVVLVIIVVIIVVAVVLGAFFIYPMIANSGGLSDDGTALTTIPTTPTIPTITKNSGATVMPTRTVKPTATPTYRPTPGNSGSTVGL